MLLGMDEGFGASGWEQDDDSGPLGLLQTACGVACGQPMLVAAVGAAVVGAVIGVVVANRTRPSTRAERVAKASRRLGRKGGSLLGGYADTASSAGKLIPPAMALLGNPIVRSLLQRAVLGALQKQFGGRRRA